MRFLHRNLLLSASNSNNYGYLKNDASYMKSQKISPRVALHKIFLSPRDADYKENDNLAETQPVNIRGSDSTKINSRILSGHQLSNGNQLSLRSCFDNAGLSSSTQYASMTLKNKGSSIKSRKRAINLIREKEITANLKRSGISLN